MLSDAAPLIGFIVPSFDCTRNRVCETLLQTEEDDDRRQRADRDRRHDHSIVDDVAIVLATSIGMVIASLVCMTTFGQRYAFHAPMNVMVAAEA